MRTLPPSLLLAAALLGGCASSGAPDGTPARRFRFTCTVKIPAPTGTQNLDVWVPLPRNDPGVQTLADERITAPAGYRVTTDPVYGNRMVHCRIASPAPVTEIQWSYTVTRWQDRGQGRLPSNARYLQPNEHIPLEGKAVEMATQLGVIQATTPLEARARIIYDDVLCEMAYDKNHEGWGHGDFEHATTVCKGNCTDFHSRFIGIGRAAGIPVRFTMGIPMKPAAKGEYNSYHCWAHWLDGDQWRPVDISEADKVFDKDPAKAKWFFGNLDHDRISLTFGRDIVLEPRQQGAPLNYFVFPYAEADGKAVKMSKKENWKFYYENVTR